MTDTAPEVSVVTTLLGADPEHLRAAAESLVAQTFRSFEWVIHECGPRACAAAVTAGLSLPRVVVIRDPKPISLAAGRSRALARAQGRLIAVFDGDDICTTARLQLQRDRFEASPNLDVLGGAVECIDEAGRRLGYRAYPTSHDDIHTLARRRNPLAHPTVMLRREALDAAGGYRDYGEGACDDYELWSRMLKGGARFANLPDVLLQYRMHVGSTKSRRLRATLRDTLSVKRDYWIAEQRLPDRARALGERALLYLPTRLVTWGFSKLTLKMSLDP